MRSWTGSSRNETSSDVLESRISISCGSGRNVAHRCVSPTSKLKIWHTCSNTGRAQWQPLQQSTRRQHIATRLHHQSGTWQHCCLKCFGDSRSGAEIGRNKMAATLDCESIDCHSTIWPLDYHTSPEPLEQSAKGDNPHLVIRRPSPTSKISTLCAAGKSDHRWSTSHLQPTNTSRVHMRH
jgi:hypothetical protein